MPPLDDLLSTDDVLRLTGRADASTVSRWVSIGRLTPAKRVGRRGAMLFWRADVEQLADELRQELVDELARLDAARLDAAGW